MSALEPWESLSSEELFSAAPWLSVHRETVRLPSGRTIDDFFRVELPEFAMVVAVTTAREIVAVCGYKHGPRRVVLSPPAGLIEPGETPLQAAQRELREETGFGGGSWSRLGTFVADGNRQCGTMHLFLARGVEECEGAHYDDAEILVVRRLSLDGARAALTSGEVATLAAMAGLAAAVAILDGEEAAA